MPLAWSEGVKMYTRDLYIYTLLQLPVSITYYFKAKGYFYDSLKPVYTYAFYAFFGYKANKLLYK